MEGEEEVKAAEGTFVRLGAGKVGTKTEAGFVLSLGNSGCGSNIGSGVFLKRFIMLFAKRVAIEIGEKELKPVAPDELDELDEGGFIEGGEGERFAGVERTGKASGGGITVEKGCAVVVEFKLGC